MATRKPKPTEPEIQLLTTAKCPSISGRGEVRYSIGVNDSKEIVIKLVGSSGGGQINNSWIPFADILELLESHSGGDAFTSGIYHSLFENQSSNNAGFMLAVTLKEKLVTPQEGKRRKYVYNSPAAFLAKVDKLTAAKASKPPSRRKTKATD